MNTALKIGGTAVGVLAGFMTALWEVFLSPLYVGRVPVPLSPVLAVGSTILLIWFTRRVTTSMGLALLPGVVWFATVLVAATKTTEGDLPMPSTDWMGLLTILAGALAWGICAYRMIVGTRPDLAPAASAKAAQPSPVKAEAAGDRAAGDRAAGERRAVPPVPGARPAGGKAGGSRKAGRKRPTGAN